MIGISRLATIKERSLGIEVQGVPLDNASRSFLDTATGQPRIRTRFPLATLTDFSVGELIVITTI